MLETPAVGTGPTVTLGAVGLGKAGVGGGLTGGPEGDGEHPSANASVTPVTTTARVRIEITLSQTGIHL